MSKPRRNVRPTPRPAHGLLVSVPVAGEMLDVSRATAWRMVYDGELPSVKIRGRRKVPVAGIHLLIEKAG